MLIIFIRRGTYLRAIALQRNEFTVPSFPKHLHTLDCICLAESLHLPEVIKGTIIFEHTYFRHIRIFPPLVFSDKIPFLSLAAIR